MSISAEKADRAGQVVVSAQPAGVSTTLVSALPPTRVDADIVMLSEPYGVRAEAIRALRTHIMAQHLAEGRRALAVCAASAGVGCTFVASNLAVALSQVGVSTLLIDANLRRPSIQRLFGGPTPLAGGLGQCLADEAPRFGRFVAAGVLDNLSVMFAGAAVPNPQELLGGAAFQVLMQSCLREFDITIVDTPAANTYADARRVASVMGYSLVVARRNVSLVADIKTLIGELTIDHAHVVGTVLNEY
jgi:capsular exopolysaccharide synthesis family protein